MAVAGAAMSSIDEVLGAFLAEQEARLAPRTFRNYEDVIYLLRACMNDYGYTSLSDSELKRWEEAYEAGEEDAYTRLFGPEKIPGELGQFLGWYVIRKVMPSQELARACGTVTKKLGKWLEANGHLDAEAAANVVERGSEAGDSLPKAEKLAELLYRESMRTRPRYPASLPEEDWVEDLLLIDRVEPGALWFEGGIGPVRVPKSASDLARPGWMVTITLARIGGEWRIAEVGNVYP